MHLHPVGQQDVLSGSDLDASQVSHDMEGIFGCADASPGEAPPSATPGITPIVPRASLRRPAAERTLILSGLVFAGLLSASLVLAHYRAPTLAAGQITKTLPPIAAQVDRSPRAPAPLAPRAISAPASRPSTAVAEAARPAAAEKPRPRARLAAIRHDVRHKATPHLAMSTPARTSPHAHAGSSCEKMGGYALARCMRPQVLDADWRLRNAYLDAARAGVDRRVLVNYRRQWSKLRNQANSDPRSVTSGYRQMAQELEATRTGRRPGDL